MTEKTLLDDQTIAGVTVDKVLSFMRYRFIALVFSLVLIVVSIVSIATQGLKFGLDFTGGTLIELNYNEAVDLQDIRASLRDEGFPPAVIVNFGSAKDVLIRMQTEDPKLGDQVAEFLGVGSDQGVSLKRTEYVGPQIGEELRDDGGLGMLFALAVVMGYVALRFQYKFSLGAVGALAHDVIIVLGVFSLLQLEFDLTVLAAILAVIGYSLNDTIVVADRIRENFRMLRKTSAIEVINVSLTQTLGRTIVTSLTTLIVLFALYFFGGELIHNFSVALIVGIVVGTYSSIYVSANMLLWMGISQDDLIQVEKEGAELPEDLLP